MIGTELDATISPSTPSRTVRQPSSAAREKSSLSKGLRERLGIRLVGIEAQLEPRIGLPVPLKPVSIRADHEKMCRREPLDALEKGTGVVDALEFRHQEIGNPSLVDPAGHSPGTRDGLGLRSADQEFARKVVGERLDAKVVAGAKHALTEHVPNHKREGALESLRCIGPPSPVGLENDFRIRGDLPWAITTIESADQLPAIVDPEITHDGQTTAVDDQRLDRNARATRIEGGES